MFYYCMQKIVQKVTYIECSWHVFENLSVISRIFRTWLSKCHFTLVYSLDEMAFLSQHNHVNSTDLRLWRHFSHWIGYLLTFRTIRVIYSRKNSRKVTVPSMFSFENVTLAFSFTMVCLRFNGIVQCYQAILITSCKCQKCYHSVNAVE